VKRSSLTLKIYSYVQNFTRRILYGLYGDCLRPLFAQQRQPAG
jgi:hypothetical protein